MKLILTRHGETKEIQEGILQGQLPGTLNEKGIKQANQLSFSLKDEKIDLIYTSDLQRSFDTAKIIQSLHEATPLIPNPLLRERSFGIFEGKNKNKIGFYESENKHIFENPQNGENNKDLIDRAKLFLNKIINNHINKTVLIVSHDDIGKALVANITGQDFNNIQSMKKASLTIIEFKNKNNFSIITFSNINHLK